MIDFEVSGLQELISDMKKAGDIPNSTLKEMVTEQAKVVEEAIVYNAGTMLQGPYYEGAVAASVTPKKARVSKTGAYVTITFKGEQHGNRLGEIAFINEYGKKSQPARPFIKKAQSQSSDPAANAAHKVLDEYISKQGL